MKTKFFETAKEFRAATALLLCLLLSTSFGCATFLGERRRIVRVSTDPPGALLYLNGIPAGKTPTYFQRSHMLGDHILTIRQKGYKEETRKLPKEFQRITLWNLINVFGWAIDAVTGNIYRFESYRVHFNLEKSDGSAEDQD